MDGNSRRVKLGILGGNNGTEFGLSFCTGMGSKCMHGDEVSLGLQRQRFLFLFVFLLANAQYYSHH